VFFAALAAYRALITQEVTETLVFRFGYNALAALIVAKVILLGRWIKLGERRPGGFLIVSVLRKAIVYTGFLVVFVVIEKVVEGRSDPSGDDDLLPVIVLSAVSSG
jgi:hypothetical protein